MDGMDRMGRTGGGGMEEVLPDEELRHDRSLLLALSVEV